MQFTYPIETPANTAETSPERLEIKLSVGIVQKVRVCFPWGCAGLVGVRILHYEHQVWPTNPDEWFIGNDITIEFEAEYWILEGPNEWKIEGYNLDDFYPHTPVIDFNVLRGGMGLRPTGGWIGA